MRPFVLGIAGGTGAGKTTLAHGLIERIGPDRCALLSLDRYYRGRDPTDRSGGRPPRRGVADAANYDEPAALDFSRLADDLSALRGGGAVRAPIYDFVAHRRTGVTDPIEPRATILVEGVLLFCDSAVRSLLDFRVYLDAGADVRLMRRLRRDMKERGRTAEGVLQQYESTVRPMHDAFVAPSRRWAHVVLPGDEDGGGVLEIVAARLERGLASKMGT